MFDIGWSEILVIAIVAIVVVGPKDLPPMLRAAGRMVTRLRKTAGEFQSQFNEALREAELDGVQDSIKELRALNPLNDIRKSLDPIQAALARPEPVMKPAPEPVVPTLSQPAQPMTDADLLPAADPLPVDHPVETAPSPVRKRKAKADPDVAGAVQPKPAAKRAAKPKTVATATDDAAPTAPARKPRVAKPKAAAPTAEAPAAPQTVDMVATPAHGPLAATGPAAPADDVAAVPPEAPLPEERS